jgi:hypothetical protein
MSTKYSKYDIFSVLNDWKISSAYLRVKLSEIKYECELRNKEKKKKEIEKTRTCLIM